MSDDHHRRLVEDLAFSSLREQRARRRWRVFFTLLFFAYLIVTTALFYQGGRSGKNPIGEPYAAVIEISGSIESGGDNSSSLINALLRDAFADEKSKGVILEINSPGGSAVESHRIYNELRRLREKHPDKPVLAVAGDFCTSGAYFIAAGADEIYADPASLVGSIGVIFSGFGFTGTMEKLGVERRVITAGENKNFLDPFSPTEAEGEAAIERILEDIHRLFVDAVKQGRGTRLITDDNRIYTGAIFSGRESLELGLVDGFNDIGGVARDIIGVEELRYYQKRSWLQQLVGRFGGVLADALMDAITTAPQYSSSGTPRPAPMTRRTAIKLALFAALVVAFALAYPYLAKFASLDYIKTQQAEFSAYYENNRLIVLGGYFCLYVFAVALSLPGAAILTLLAGALFGLLVGTLLVSFASSIGATLAFLAARFLFGEALQKKYGNTEIYVKLNNGIAQEGGFYLFTMRLIPAFPFFLINLLMALTKIRTVTFYWVSQLGMLAGTIVFVYAGTALAEVERVQDILSAPLLAAFVAIGLLPLASKKLVAHLRQRRQP